MTNPDCADPFHLTHGQVAGVNVIHNRYPAGHQLEQHEHDVATVYLVLRGSHEERGRGKAIDCTCGSVIFSPRGACHSDHYGNAGGEAFLIEIPERVLEHARDGGILLDDPLHLAGGSAAPVMRRLHEEMERSDELTPISFEALLLQLLVVLRREGSPRAPQAPQWLARVRELVNDRFAERLSLADVAASAGVHPIHLATTFHRVFGMTFGAYLRSVRVEHARRALIASDKTVAEIALACGFFDQSHLSRVFRETTGSSPARYRLLARG